MKTSRRFIQLGFLVLTAAAVFVVRGNAERWCPLGGVETLYQYASDGNLICSLGVSNLYILAAVLLLTLLVRRAFCGYACPIGTVSEWLQRGAERLGLRAWRTPYPLDRGLALLKYAVLAVILFFTWRTGELVFRGYDPCYALLSRHGEDITFWAYLAAGAVALASLVSRMPFCRWLCPLAAVMTPFSRFGLARIKRDGAACMTCGECTQACPMGIRVDSVPQVTAARCIGCFECIEVCPRQAGAMHWGPPNWIAQRWPRPLMVVILLVCIGAAVATAYAIPLPAFVQAWGDRPARVTSVDVEINGLTCRGRATQLVYFLQRDDEYAVPGYVKVEAWPAPREAAARISFDATQASAVAIKQAITEAYFDRTARRWRSPPFEIRGYDPLEPNR